MLKNEIEDKKQAIQDGDLIEISKELLYQTWIDKPMFFTSILYFTIIKDQEKEVERFRLFQVLEKIGSALVDSVKEKEIGLQVELGKFRYDLMILQAVDEYKNLYLTVGFAEDFQLDSEPVYQNENQINAEPKQKISQTVEDHLFSFFKGLYLEDKDTAVKLYHCSMKDLFKISIETEYEPGKRYNFVQIKTSVLPNTDRTLHITDYREKYLQVTPKNIIQKGLVSEKRKQVPFYELHKVLEAITDDVQCPSLEALFDIYDPRLKFTINFPPGIKYPSKMVIKKRVLYSAEDMAGYLLKGIPKDKAAEILLNLDLEQDIPAKVHILQKALRVSTNPMDAVDNLLNQEKPYNIKPLFRTPFREGIILADRLGYQVDWGWTLEIWDQKTDEWEKEEQELLSLIPEQIENQPSHEELKEAIDRLDSDDIPF